MIKRIVILGVTGSIGINSCKVVKAFSDKFEIVGVSAGRNIEKLNEIIEDFPTIKSVTVAEESLKRDVKGSCNVCHGEYGLIKLLDLKPDILLVAVSGKAGWKVTLEALKRGIKVALANKESLVIAGTMMGRKVTSDRDKIVPVDSEHASLMQLFKNANRDEIKKVYITASGGALLSMTKEEVFNADAEKALNHPVWDMGMKVTVDSATMLNKGMELIEAYWLFDVQPNKLDVIVHPEVGIHAALEFKDGSISANISPSDMKLPIANALSWPKLLNVTEKIPELNYSIFNKTYTFYKPDMDKYPLLHLAIELLKDENYSGMIAYAISDEVAVTAFLKNEITVKGIVDAVTAAVEEFRKRVVPETVVEMNSFIAEIEIFTAKLIKENICF